MYFFYNKGDKELFMFDWNDRKQVIKTMQIYRFAIVFHLLKPSVCRWIKIEIPAMFITFQGFISVSHAFTGQET